uniref:Protein kish-B n=1 Tax=Gallus gallus TaxID=9031 RepID=A0A8V1A1M9_CHICK
MRGVPIPRGPMGGMGSATELHRLRPPLTLCLSFSSRKGLHGAAQLGTVRHGVAGRSVAQHGKVWHGTVRNGTAWCVYSLDGLLVFGLLLVCTCAYLRKVPRLRAWLLSEKRGLWGVGYKVTLPGRCGSRCSPTLSPPRPCARCGAAPGVTMQRYLSRGSAPPGEGKIPVTAGPLPMAKGSWGLGRQRRTLPHVRGRILVPRWPSGGARRANKRALSTATTVLPSAELGG